MGGVIWWTIVYIVRKGGIESDWADSTRCNDKNGLLIPDQSPVSCSLAVGTSCIVIVELHPSVSHF